MNSYLFITVILYLCSFLVVSTQTNQIQTYYISFLTKILSNDPLSTSDEKTINQLLNTDDSPFVGVTLPFPILLFSKYYQRLYVNPNGAAHISKTQPCPQNDFSEEGCNFNTSYYGVFAGLLTDLQISSGCPGADISYFSSKNNQNNLFTVAFRRLCYFGTFITNSFRITVFDDNHIEIGYDRISRSNNLPVKNYWVSGVRLPQNDVNTLNPTVNMNAWNYVIPGIYPLPSQVTTGNKFVVCPISSLWCLRNSTIQWNEELNKTTIQLTTSELSCTSSITYSLGFSLENHLSTISLSNYLPCSANAKTGRLSCKFNVLFNYLLNQKVSWSTLPVYLWIAWKDSTLTTASYHAIDLPSIQLTIENSTTLPHNGQHCYINQYYSSCSSVNNCSFCNQDFSCFNNTCYQENNYQTIYSDLSCNNICLEPNITSPSSLTSPILTSNVTDGFGKCCQEKDLDCAGDCFGNNTMSSDYYGNSYCCPASLTVDCNGICDGKAVIDICGICGGGDFIGYSCFNSSLVFLSSPEADTVALYPKFNLTLQEFSITSSFYIINLSEEDINATAWVSSNYNHTDPDITFHNNTLYNNNFYIPKNTSLQIAFNISMERFQENPNNEYVFKDIEVEYNRIGFPKAIYRLTIPVYPRFIECDIKIGSNSMHSCMRYPGCMYCLNFPDIKVLHSNGKSIIYYEDSTDTFYKLPHGTQNSRRRRLFSNLIPNPYKVKNRNILHGTCIDGYYQTDCDNYNNKHYKSTLTFDNSVDVRSSWSMIAIFFGIFAVFVLL